MPPKAAGAYTALRGYIRLVHDEVEVGDRVRQPLPSTDVKVMGDSIPEEAEHPGLEENAEACLETDLRPISW